MKLFYGYMVIFFNLSPTSSHLHPLQVENCDSNSRLVVDEDDNGKFRPDRVKIVNSDLKSLTTSIYETSLGLFTLEKTIVYWPKSTRHFPSVCLTLAHRLRR